MAPVEPARPADDDGGTAPLRQPRSVEVRLGALERMGAEEAVRAEQRMRRLMEVLERIHDDDAGGRRRLAEVRGHADYALAWEDPNPLVSVVIPTYSNTTALTERSVPSALAQTHANVEVVVVGDAAPEATGAALRTIGDSRVHYENRLYNGPYPEDRHAAWLASGTPPLNEAVRLARGRWLAPLGDDDAFEPDHVERLLQAARERRLEYVYGLIRQVMPDGSESLLGTFPPRSHQTGVQAAIYRRELSFVEAEPAHALFGTPNDWGIIHRMLRLGVRIGMVEEVSTTYWPSGRGGSAATPLDASTGLLAELEAIREALERTERERCEAQELVVDLERRLEDVRRSRSWRLTAPLRRGRGR